MNAAVKSQMSPSSPSGHEAILVEAKGEGPQRALGHMATRTSGWCNAALPTEDIIAKIQAGEFALYDARRKNAAASPGAAAEPNSD